MAAFSRDEVQTASCCDWQTGAVREDRGAWADLFTPDAVRVEHVLGHRQGREAIDRRDDPGPGGGVIDFPRVAVLLHAGRGLWTFEEDSRVPAETITAGQRYAEARAAHDPDHPGRRSRRNGPDTPAWAAPGRSA